MRGDSGFPVRVRFAKRGKVRFISHRDVARAFERAFRIEQLPLAFTEGFSPRPKVSFGLALSVGHESDAEYLDVELTERDRRRRRCPTGSPRRCPKAWSRPARCSWSTAAPALQEAVTEVQFRIAAVDGRGDPCLRIGAPHRGHARRSPADELAVTRTRKGKESVDDIRPAIRTIQLAHDAEGPVLELASVYPTPRRSSA